MCFYHLGKLTYHFPQRQIPLSELLELYPVFYKFKCKGLVLTND